MGVDVNKFLWMICIELWYHLELYTLGNCNRMGRHTADDRAFVEAYNTTAQKYPVPTSSTEYGTRLEMAQSRNRKPIRDYYKTISIVPR